MSKSIVQLALVKFEQFRFYNQFSASIWQRYPASLMARVAIESSRARTRPSQFVINTVAKIKSFLEINVYKVD